MKLTKKGHLKLYFWCWEKWDHLPNDLKRHLLSFWFHCSVLYCPSIYSCIPFKLMLSLTSKSTEGPLLTVLFLSLSLFKTMDIIVFSFSTSISWTGCFILWILSLSSIKWLCVQLKFFHYLSLLKRFSLCPILPYFTILSVHWEEEMEMTQRELYFNPTAESWVEFEVLLWHNIWCRRREENRKEGESCYKWHIESYFALNEKAVEDEEEEGTHFSFLSDVSILVVTQQEEKN